MIMKVQTIFLLLLLESIRLVAFAQDFTNEGICYTIISDTEKMVSVRSNKSNPYSANVTIPEKTVYEGVEYTVVSVAESCFSGCKDLVSVILPKTIQTIGRSAFWQCKITSLTIPAQVREIGNNAFMSCKHLERISFDGNVIETIGDHAFQYCESLTSFSMPNSLISIGEGCFANTLNLQEVTIGLGLSEISHSAFMDSAITGINIPSNIKKIGNYAFAGCKYLAYVSFNEELNEIGEYAFQGCNALRELYVPNSVTTIGRHAFCGSGSGYGNPVFPIAEIGNGIKKIDQIFNGFNSAEINKLIIGNQIESIIGKAETFGNTNLKKTTDIFLLTNNIVTFTHEGTYGPYCTIYVADSTKYSESSIKKFGIKNIIFIPAYRGEYTGSIPDVKITNNLSEYSFSIDKTNLEVGTHSFVKVNYSRDKMSSAISVPCKWIITKAPLKIICDNVSVSYGEEIPNLSCTYTGFKNGETALTALSSLPTLSTNAKKDSDAGTYRIYASGADAKNYSITYQEGTLTIKKAKQSITWNQSFGTNNYADTQIELSAVSSCGLPIEYSTSDQSVAFVSHDNGKYILHLLKEGTVLVTASQSGTNNHEPAESISKTVKVVARLATGITLDKSNETLKIGETITLKATVTPSSIENKEVVWKSSDESVATVSNGVVKGVKEGIVTITATTCDGSNLSASCIINVNPILATSISLNKNNASILAGSTLQLTATVSPQNVTNGAVNWSSSDTEIAVVDDGLITALKPGSVMITATTSDGTNLTATCSLTITSIVATSISMDKTTATLKAGETVQLVATIKPDNVENKKVTWISSDKSIATVNDGLVTAISYGTATITAITTDGTNLTASCVVYVESIPVVSLSLDKESVSLFVEEQTVLNASVYPENVGNKVVSWSSSDGNVAVVDNGKVTAKNEGKAIITAKSTDGSNISASCSVTVSRHQQELIWNQDISSIAFGGELIKLTAESSSGLPVTYTSSDDNVASIFDLGETIYLNPNNCGKAQVTVTQKGNYYYAPAEMSKDVQVVNLDGIEEILNDNNVISVYSINGLKIGTYSNGECPRLPSGVYIVNGKKVCIK